MPCTPRNDDDDVYVVLQMQKHCAQDAKDSHEFTFLTPRRTVSSRNSLTGSQHWPIELLLLAVTLLVVMISSPMSYDSSATSSYDLNREADSFFVRSISCTKTEFQDPWHLANPDHKYSEQSRVVLGQGLDPCIRHLRTTCATHCSHPDTLPTDIQKYIYAGVLGIPCIL